MARLRGRGLLLLPIVLAASATAFAARAAWPAGGAPAPRAVAETAAKEAPTRSPSSSPLRGMAPPSGEAPREGVVAEHLDAGPYTYLRIARAEGGGDAWIATLGDGEPVGTRVGIRSLGSRTNFPSRRLDRVFPRLDFALVTKLQTSEDLR